MVLKYFFVLSKAQEAREEEAEKRRRKFAKMEEEREKTRVIIREKVNFFNSNYAI